MSANPLLQPADLPPLDLIEAEHVVPALEQLISDNTKAVDDLLSNSAKPGWQTLAMPMEALGERLSDAWSPVSHLHGVANGEAIREAYDQALPLLTEYSTRMGQNSELYQAYQALADSGEFATLDATQQKAINNTLRDFRLSGVALGEADKKRFAELQQRMAELNTRFSNQVLDATQGWIKHVPRVEDLDGVPESVLDTLSQQARARDLEGYVVTLDIPCYLPVMQYASNRELREELYQAYTTRASDQGPNAGDWDNSQVMADILAVRHELASLLGYANYAELSLATKMASSTDEVEGFLRELAAHSRPVALKEYEELKAFAKETDGIENLSAWDVPYYAELLRKARYDISPQQLRPYFPAPKVIAGMFEVVGRLFGITIEAQSDFATYHPDVTFYHVKRNGEHIASFYLDAYARENKRGGAWMADCRNRRRDAAGQLHKPVAFLTCNFTPPGEGSPSLLTHDEVTTLFHEFGHGLHHMLTQVEVAAVSGINGVAWDAVELPSQFMENWCWQKEGLDLISGHFETGEALPAELLEKMLAAKNFQSGMQMVRQLEFSLFDFIMHRDYNPEAPQEIQEVLDAVRSEVSVVPTPAFNRFQHGFSHIFAGGYAAGYYSYKWAEVLSADAFSAFEEEGIFNADTGGRFMHEILEQGGSKEPAELFQAFRGREPSTQALLRHSGITGEA